MKTLYREKLYKGFNKHPGLFIGFNVADSKCFGLAN